MCGFCGIVSARPEAEISLISKMLKPLNTRGPDACGAFFQGNFAFGHRRLSILDLAPTSQQPMVDPELGLGIVFNGCVYNFRELRQELIAEGYRFFSDGDTEVTCLLGCEGIVSKRKGSRYPSGKSFDWMKSKHPDSPAKRRETKEDWQ